ncbi:MAG: redoxin domain-containing protein [Anaerolineae bacterium]
MASAAQRMKIQAKQMGRRQRDIRVLLVFGVAVGLLALAMIVFGGGSSSTLNFRASTLTGETVQLSDYRGKVVMLNFWATWCPPCQAEMPAIQAAYTRYHDQGFTVLAINYGEHPSQIEPFASALALQFPIVLDIDARLQGVFGITGYPTSMFIAPNGEVYATHSGMLTERQLEGYITQGLAQLE